MVNPANAEPRVRLQYSEDNFDDYEVYQPPVDRVVENPNSNVRRSKKTNSVKKQKLTNTHPKYLSTGNSLGEDDELDFYNFDVNIASDLESLEDSMSGSMDDTKLATEELMIDGSNDHNTTSTSGMCAIMFCCGLG